MWFQSKNALGFEGVSASPAIEMGITDGSDNILNGNSPFVTATSIQPVVINDKFKKYPPGSKLTILPIDYGIGAGQCVKYVQYVTGVDLSGNAVQWASYINSDNPNISDIVVIRYSKYVWHVGIVIKVDKDSITVRSRNVKGKYIVSDDKFQLADSRLIGFIDY